MAEKRFRMETIGDIMLPFIVDNSTAKKKSDTTTTYHTYETHRKEKCLELVDLLNDFSEENKQLKQEVSHWKKILDDYQQIVAKTLREQYHWLKNEDKILNHDKTVALLELESISARLGIDLI